MRRKCLSWGTGGNQDCALTRDACVYGRRSEFSRTKTVLVVNAISISTHMACASGEASVVIQQISCSQG